MLQKFKSKTNPTILAVLSLVVLGFLSVFFYIQFNSFKPAQGVDLNQIDGNRIAHQTSIPKPDDAEILGVSRSDNTTQTIYETIKKPGDIQTFYKNILQNEGWKLDLEETTEETLKIKFVKENESITITASPQNNSEKTVVSANQISKN